ncbi:LptF/LptG family permease [Acetobacter peroxydans]|uniref:LptF/LptG family permease n=1 Tax=Acetobacter peroxydans TaxID=104098 RepID=UPI002353C329|nr:LptF/LptG family permease [Acetobacter peroxydans]MCH4143059.1 LptF/LptG family permease [Acetobacter peroxydans]MCI1411594.1 LptF/LptG family permease [Acetobacter peroxydans]MCI1439143.1 LptF/LptG family permease [Acetobacter peroxydans]MCI1566771.1 LptF/LptG family permease [Acetobacter peroxydans]MCI1618919.1 LptF/LptG family permease [Acetobacter peroxydans]
MTYARSRMVRFKNWLKTLYVRQFLRIVLLQAAMAMGVIEAIFLAERVPMIFRDVIHNHVSVLDTGLIFLLSAPQILDLALPLVLTVAVYRTVLAMRENRELLVLCASGQSPFACMRPLGLVTVAALVCSIASSGFINPAALYSQRLVLFSATYHYLITPSPQSQLFLSQKRTLYIPSRVAADHVQNAPTGHEALFIYEPVDKTHFRIIQAEGLHATGFPPEKLLAVNLSQMLSRIFTITDKPEVEAPCCADTQDNVTADKVYKALALDDILPFAPRNADGAELTLPELFFPSLEKIGSQASTRLAMERLARALLCLLAPLVALVALSQTTQRNSALPLPAGCLLLMSCNVVTQWLMGFVIPHGVWVSSAALLACAALLCGLLLLLLRATSNRLLLPQLFRA